MGVLHDLLRVTTLTFNLPWPDPALSPNSRDRYAKMTAVTDARNYARLIVWEWLNENPQPKRPERVKTHYRFYPPDKRWRDDDNMISMAKAARDGLFEGLGWNDHISRGGSWDVLEVRKGGEIEYTIEIVE